MKKTRVRCPFCGYMAYERDFDKDNLVRLEAFIHKFGGRYPNSKRGISEFIKIESSTVLGVLRDKIVFRLMTVANFFGYALKKSISYTYVPSMVLGVRSKAYLGVKSGLHPTAVRSKFKILIRGK